MITINARGARTLADASPLVYNGNGVFVTYSDGEWQLHIDNRIVATCGEDDLDGGTRTAQDWAYEVAGRMGITFGSYWVEPEAEVEPVATAGDPEIEVDEDVAERAGDPEPLLTSGTFGSTGPDLVAVVKALPGSWSVRRPREYGRRSDVNGAHVACEVELARIMGYKVEHSPMTGSGRLAVKIVGGYDFGCYMYIYQG